MTVPVPDHGRHKPALYCAGVGEESANIWRSQLEQLRIGLDADRPQLVVMTSEDKDSIGNQPYKAKIDELARLPRDRTRFELVITDKNRIADTVVAKLQTLRQKRRAAATMSGHGKRTAFVDAHEKDTHSANQLVAYLEKQQVDTSMRASAGDFRRIDEAVKKSALYIIVAGNVDGDWVSNRKDEVRKSQTRCRAPLLVGKYAAAEGDTNVAVATSRLEIVAEYMDYPGWVDALLAPDTKDQA